MAASITLQKFGIIPDEEDNQVFTFIFENPKKLLDTKSVESSEVLYAGHRWSVVVMRKEERYMGISLKWKYSDGPSAGLVSCKAKYQLTLIHRHDFTLNKLFLSTQKFNSSQSLLGKSKFVSLDSLLDLSDGFLDDTGKRIILELSLTRCSTRYEKTIDTSPSARTRKNASGYYFDTSTFAIGNQKWYLRAYPEKINANGLPAVYLYLANKSLSTSIEMNFLLNIGEDCTEILNYTYGEGAKFDGFGKTLPEPLYNVKKVSELTVGVDISSFMVYKIASVRLKGGTSGYNPRVYKEFGSSYSRQPGAFGNSLSNSALIASEAFQDQEGNYWKTDVVKDARKLTLTFDKGVHHFPHNRTKLLCWSVTLLSRDPDSARDLEMEMEPILGYFSNFIDDKGYLMCFPVDLAELETRENPYTDDNGELLFRINLISLQTIPTGLRTVPRFDYQIKHLLRAKQQLRQNIKNLDDMREMSASRASLSLLDLSSPNDRDERHLSESSGGLQEKLFKSYDSLDALSTGDMMPHDDDYGRHFYCDILRHLAKATANSPQTNGAAADTGYVMTGRDGYQATREDMSTESGVTVSDESSLLMEARSSPVDTSKQKEIVALLIKFLNQRLPLRITEVLEAGSLGTGTGTRSRSDVDLIIFSPDLPYQGQSSWLTPTLRAIHTFLKNASANPDPFYPLPTCSEFAITPTAVQFNCGGLDVDVMIAYDWESEDAGGYVGLYAHSLKQTTPRGRQWCSLASTKLQKKFVFEQPNEVKELIKVVKHWRNCVQWRETNHRPNSYMLSLLVIKAVEDTRSFDMKRVLQKMGSYVMEPELSLSWTVYYIPDKYPVKFDPPAPLIRDPSNPGVNIAESLGYWGQFRSEVICWLKSLGIVVNGLGSTTS